MKTIEQVLDEHPTLDSYGFASYRRTDPSFHLTREERVAQFRERVGEINACVEWLSGVRRIKTIDRHWTSYGLKHEVERDCRMYISNGAFIMAALILGYPMRRDDGPNASFGMSLRDIHRRRYAHNAA